MSNKKTKLLSTLFVSLGLLSCVKTSELNAQDRDLGTKIAGGVIVAGTVTAVGVSFMYGIYNLQADNKMLQEIEARYDLAQVYDWYQLPGHYLVQTLCNNGYQADLTAVELPGIKAIKSKIVKISDVKLFDFSSFVAQLPHVDQNGYYCVAKKYFNDFGCVTLTDLTQTIELSMVTIEQDFKKLKKLTNLSNATLLPVNYNEFNYLEYIVRQGMQSPIINSSLGVFGYSALFNGERVKTCVMSLVKYHAYLSQLKELLGTCIDDLDTNLQSGGNLQFSLEHANHVQVNIIK